LINGINEKAAGKAPSAGKRAAFALVAEIESENASWKSDHFFVSEDSRLASTSFPGLALLGVPFLTIDAVDFRAKNKMSIAEAIPRRRFRNRSSIIRYGNVFDTERNRFARTRSHAPANLA